MSSPSRVLIVDRSRESRDLLRSMLVRQGAEVLEARELGSGAQLAAGESPDLIVLDDDSAREADVASAARLAAAAARNDVPIVVLGTLKWRTSPIPTDQLVAKPYQYGALIRRIEELLGSRA